MPAKKVPLETGVKTSPSFTIKMLAVAVSATLPIASATSALSKPLERASTSIRALLGYKQPAFAFTTASSSTGRLNRVSVRRTEVVSGASGISSRHIAKPTVSFLGTMALMSPSRAQYIGLM